MSPTTVFHHFRSALEHIEARFGDLAYQEGEAVSQELAKAQHGTITFLEGLKAHTIQYRSRYSRCSGRLSRS
jgi:hypothetical protein